MHIANSGAELSNEKDPQKLFNALKSGTLSIDDLLARPTESPMMNSGAAMNKRTFTSKSVSHRESQYEKDRILRQTALSRRLSFISHDFDSIYQLTQGLVLVGARSGHAKSTTTACLVASFLQQTPTDSAIVISNEESSEAVLNRIACVLLKKNFKALHYNTMSQREQAQVRAKVTEIIPRVEVVDDDAWDMTCLEDVQAVLEFAAKSSARIVIIDYLQTVAFSKERKDLTDVQVSKLLGLYLKDYGKRVGIPVVAFAQLKPEAEGSKNFSDRVQNDRTMYNHAFSAIEIVPDFKNRTTKFIFHKNRFGTEQGATLTLKFVDGRYEGVDVEL
jgi:predicted ATP-dependent serine protease